MAKTQSYTLPDGTVIDNVPANMSRSEIAGRLIDAGYGSHFGTIDPTEGMSGLDKYRAGWGKWISERGTGISQRLGLTSDQDVEAMQRRDAPLMATSAGKSGYNSSAITNLMATAAIPGVNTLAGAAGVGATYGFSEPTTSKQDPIHNMLRSASLSAGGQVVGNIASGAAPLTNQLNPTQQRLIELGKQYGLSYPAAQQTGSKALQYFDTQLAALPGGGAMRKLYEKPHEQLASQVMKQAGVEGPATTETLKAAQKSTQDGFTNIFRDVNIVFDKQFINQINKLRNEANRLLAGNEPQRSTVMNQIDNLWFSAKPVAQNKMAIPGDVYQLSSRGTLREAGAGNGTTMGTILKQVQRSLDDLAARNLGKSAAGVAKDLRREYAIQKELAKIIPAAEARGGTFTPSGLLPGFGGAPGPMGDLAMLGKGLTTPPQSGTAPRQVMSALALGSAPALVTGSLPAAIAGLTAPWLLSTILSRPFVQKYLAQGHGLLSPKMQKLMTAGSRTGGLMSPTAIEEIYKE